MRLRTIEVICFSALTITVFVLFGMLRYETKQNNTQEKYSLLSKRLLASSPNDVIIDFQPLRNDIHDYFEKINSNHSFYFEYLPSGVSIRDGDSNELIAASLMKIPLVMNLYKTAEVGQISMDESFSVLPEDINADGEYGNTAKLVAGNKLTLRQAAKITLTDSDNTTAHFISRLITPKVTDASNSINYLDLEIAKQETDGGTYATIGARSYSSILKCLYLSCFLSPTSSQEILTVLSNSNDNSRIKAGLPDSVLAASKIGSFSNQTQSDCGIVYVPARPFLVCVLLFASDDHANTYISDLTKICYDYVKNYTPGKVTGR